MKIIFKNNEKVLKELRGETVNWNAALRDVAETFKVLGISADSFLGAMLGGITAIMSGVQRLQETLIEVWGDSPKGFRGLIDLALDDLNSFLSAIVGIGQAIAGVISTAQAQGPLAGALSGALAGGQIGEALFGPGGALAGAIVGAIGGALIGLFGKPEFKKAMEDVAKNFGVAISEELGKAIADTAKKLDIGRFEASLLKFADILAEAGGLSADNVEQFTARFNDLINAVASGAIPAAEGIEALNEGFTAMVEGLEEMGVKGAVIMGQFVNQIKAAGLEIASVNEFIREKAASAISHC
jgi:hypothetical protein